MRPLRIRKDVVSGTLVTRKHGWVVPLTDNESKAFGVFQGPLHQTAYLKSGDRVVLDLPLRIVTWGATALYGADQ